MTATLLRSTESAQYLLTRILADAVDQRLLLPAASELTSYSQHLNTAQQQYCVRTEAGDFFIERLSAEGTGIERFRAEQDGLLRIMETQSIVTAQPITCGVVDGHSYLILTHTPLAVHGDWLEAGRQIAEMHSHTSDKGYGFEHTTFCGDTPQNNNWSNHWAHFFSEQRIAPLLTQLEMRGDGIRGRERILARCQTRLLGHQPEASLLHGDLWSGNIAFRPDVESSRPVVFDPACYYGDAETDLAMTELFGRFPEAFYKGYQSVRSIDDGYAMRRPVYQLYHVLNHAVLFGNHYMDQAREIIKGLAN